MANIRATLRTAINTALTLAEPTYLDLLVLVIEESYRTNLVTTQKHLDHITRRHWADLDDKSITPPSARRTEINTSRNRLETLLDSPNINLPVGQYHSTLRLREWLDEGKMVIVDLGLPLHRDTGVDLGNMIMAQITAETFLRGRGVKSRTWRIIVDEFHLFVGQPFADIIRDGRSFNVFPVVAHQDRGQFRTTDDGESPLKGAVGHAGVSLNLHPSVEDRVSLAALYGPEQADTFLALKQYKAVISYYASLADSYTSEAISLNDRWGDPVPGQLAALQMAAYPRRVIVAAIGTTWMASPKMIQGKHMSQSPAANPKPKQIRRPKFGHDRTLAKPVDLVKLLNHPQALPALVSLDRHGLLTNGTMQDLLFRDHRAEDPNLKNPEEAMKRQANRLIIQLKDAELLERRMVQLISDNGFPYAHPFNILSRKGADILTRYYARHGGTLRWTDSVLKLKPHTYAHSLDINHFFVALQRACWAQDIDLSYWIDDRQLANIDRSQTLFENYPDAFFMLEKDGHTFTHFLEIDRGTESLYLISGDNDWATKAERYGRLLKTNFARAPFFAELPAPIVLIVVTGGERRTINILGEISNTGGHGSYWATTAARLYPDKQTDHFWHPAWNTPDGEIRSLLDRVCLTHLS